MHFFFSFSFLRDSTDQHAGMLDWRFFRQLYKCFHTNNTLHFTYPCSYVWPFNPALKYTMLFIYLICYVKTSCFELQWNIKKSSCTTRNKKKKTYRTQVKQFSTFFSLAPHPNTWTKTLDLSCIRHGKKIIHTCETSVATWAPSPLFSSGFMQASQGRRVYHSRWRLESHRHVIT